MLSKKRTESVEDTIKKVFREYAEALLIAIIIAVLLRFFIISAYKIPTSSMAPNLKIGDFIFANKTRFGFSWPWREAERFLFRPPQRGDVVVFKCPQEKSINCVKRVIALPGDKLQLIKKNLFINGKKAEYSRGEAELIADMPGADYALVLLESIGGHQRSIMLSANEHVESFGPVVVPPEHFFVLGDSRDSSDDSRFWGAVPYSSLQAKVMFIWMSLDWTEAWNNQGLPRIRWERVLSWVN